MVISQPKEVTVVPLVQDTTLPCSVTHLCRGSAPGGTFRWFVFRHASHQEIHAQDPKYSTGHEGLTIHSPRTNDSGVYYCSLVPRSSAVRPSIGPGTRLVVRGKLWPGEGGGGVSSHSVEGQ